MQTIMFAAGLGTLGVYAAATLAVTATTLRAAQARQHVGRAWQGSDEQRPQRRAGD